MSDSIYRLKDELTDLCFDEGVGVLIVTEPDGYMVSAPGKMDKLWESLMFAVGSLWREKSDPDALAQARKERDVFERTALQLQEELNMWREGICPADVGTSRPGYDGPEVTCETCPSADGCKFKRVYDRHAAPADVWVQARDHRSLLVQYGPPTATQWQSTKESRIGWRKHSVHGAPTQPSEEVDPWGPHAWHKGCGSNKEPQDSAECGECELPLSSPGSEHCSMTHGSPPQRS